jgi:prolyl 4-hydroxylase
MVEVRLIIIKQIQLYRIIARTIRKVLSHFNIHTHYNLLNYLLASKISVNRIQILEDAMIRCLLLCLSLLGTYATMEAKQETFDIEVLSWKPRIILLHNFLSNQECAHLISQATPKLERSKTIDREFGGEKIVDARTSQGMFFDHRGCDSIISRIEEKISHLTMMPIQYGETIQVLRYGPGEEFQPHHDYFDHESVGGKEALENGGQRMATLIMYLNSVEEGGETIFPELDLKIAPKKGNAVLFYNCHPDGNEDPLTLHGGAPVVQGTKWIATKWIHLEEIQLETP